MVEKINDEVREKARDMRRAGRSIRQIAGELRIGTGSVYRAVADVKPETASEEATPKSELVRDAKKGEVPLNEEVVDLANTVRKLELEAERRQAERKLRVLEAEEELALREREIEIRERRIQIEAVKPGEAGSAAASGDSAGSQAVLDELAKLQSERAALEAEKVKLIEERHRLELSSLEDKIAALSVKLDGAKQVGKNQYDLVSEGLSLVGKELNEGRKDIISLLRSPEVMARFNSRRGNLALRAQQGNLLASALEGRQLGQLECPGCRQSFPVDQETLQGFETLQCPACQMQFPNPLKKGAVKVEKVRRHE